MRIRNLGVALIALTLAVGSCSDNGGLGLDTRPVPVGPSFTLDATSSLPVVRISEFHYDNAGTDADERIEISGPAGTDLTGWSVVLYNGNGGASYNTRALSGTIPTVCDTRGVIVLTYPVDGIQNGSPDGIALVAPGNALVEFFSYEGTFTAAGGAANGTLSTDIGVSEPGTTTLGHSLSRNGSGVWSGPATNTFGACNDNDGSPPAEVASVTVSPSTATIVKGATQAFVATAFDAVNQPISGVTFTWVSSVPSIVHVDANGLATAFETGDVDITATANGKSDTASLHVDEAPPPPSGSVHISEIHYDNDGVDTGEMVEVDGPAGLSLNGWTVVLYNGSGGAPYGTLSLSGMITDLCGGRGVVVVPGPSTGIQNGSPDGIALVNNAGQLVEFLSYEGAFAAVGGPASGKTSVDIGVSQNGSPIGRSLQRDMSTGKWYGPAPSSFTTCNPPPPSNFVNVFGRDSGDPLPVGFEGQIFADLIGPDGNEIPTSFTWESLTPTIATVDTAGVVRALTAGTATIRATATLDGKTGTLSLSTYNATASSVARYDGNTEFGVPRDSDPSDDIIVQREQYTASYSKARGIPNWVSFNLEGTHIGGQDRCNCFTFDPKLPADVDRYTTADYVGTLEFYGFQYNRGHLLRSFDRTAGSLDNATTFYFTNIVPQTADNNQGPWAALEDSLGKLAGAMGSSSNKELYVVAGVSGKIGTLMNRDRITIPANLWKVAVIMPRDHGLAHVRDYRDLEVIAVIMPNLPGIQGQPWTKYRATVDEIEALSGYDLLALLPDKVEAAVESNTKPPFAVLDAPSASTEGAPVTMTAAGSLDPNGTIVSYEWRFGDGATATGATVSHTYAQDGSYTVQLVVTDNDGLVDMAASTVVVSNVTPAIAAFPGATLLPGETYSASGSFTDPGADSWIATVDYGDGSGQKSLPLTGKSFSLSHAYATPGSFTVTVRIRDDHATATRQQSVIVLTPAQGTRNVIRDVDQLVATGALAAGTGNALTSKLDAAVKQLEANKITPAVNQIEAFLHQVDALVKTDRLSDAKAAPLRIGARRVIKSVSP